MGSRGAPGAKGLKVSFPYKHLNDTNFINYSVLFRETQDYKGKLEVQVMKDSR